MKRTATITWISYYNYGTYLQAYALQQVIKSLGYENNVLDDVDIVKKENRDIKTEIKNFLFYITSNRFRKYYKSQKKSFKAYDRFKKNHIILEKNISDISYLNKKYDVFICGSDQIWNPNFLILPKNKYYFADFVSDNKISYAPSIGVNNIPEIYKEEFIKLISTFKKLSAREPEGKDEMQRLISKEVTLVLDPTLLLKKEEWVKLIPSYKVIQDKYILAYFLTQNNIYINAVQNFAKKRGYKLKMFFNNKNYSNLADEVITAGPIEFLESIKNADFVFTDSFHGSIFSAIFNVQFVTFVRFKGNKVGQNTRVVNLLSMMNLSDRLISENNISNIECLSKINFKEVEISLDPHIKASLNYLIESIDERNM